MRRTEEDSITPGAFWPGVADSLLAALMMVLLLAFGALAIFSLNPDNSLLKFLAMQRQIDALQRERATLTAENERLQQEIQQLRAKREPPIIELTDAQSLNFESGKARISEEFSRRLQTQEFVRLMQIISAYPVVDTIEIIGHTDDSRIASARSNLDAGLLPVLAGSASAESLTAGSNADLGLMRAVAVQQEWLRWLASSGSPLPRPITVRCYSAANAVSPPNADGLEKKERDRKARRIEIRFTQLGRAKTTAE